MSIVVLENYINGEFVASAATETLDLINPVDESVVGRTPVSTKEDVDAAVEAAQRAFETWGKTTPSVRQAALLKLADAIEAHSDEIVAAESANTGQAHQMIADEEVKVGADQMRFFAGAARLLEGKAAGEYMEGFTSYVRREPIGVVGQVTPWNYPFMMALWKIGPALAAGNTIVLKPSDTTPGSTLVLAKLSKGILPDACSTSCSATAEPERRWWRTRPSVSSRSPFGAGGHRCRRVRSTATQARAPRTGRQSAGDRLRRRRHREDRHRHRRGSVLQRRPGLHRGHSRDRSRVHPRSARRSPRPERREAAPRSAFRS